MFLKRRPHTIRIRMKLQQAFRQCSVIQSFFFEQITDDRLVLTRSQQRWNILPLVLLATGIE